MMVWCGGSGGGALTETLLWVIEMAPLANDAPLAVIAVNEDEPGTEDEWRNRCEGRGGGTGGALRTQQHTQQHTREATKETTLPCCTGRAALRD